MLQSASLDSQSLMLLHFTDNCRCTTTPPVVDPIAHWTGLDTGPPCVMHHEPGQVAVPRAGGRRSIEHRACGCDVPRPPCQCPTSLRWQDMGAFTGAQDGSGLRWVGSFDTRVAIKSMWNLVFHCVLHVFCGFSHVYHHSIFAVALRLHSLAKQWASAKNHVLPSSVKCPVCLLRTL